MRRFWSALGAIGSFIVGPSTSSEYGRSYGGQRRGHCPACGNWHVEPKFDAIFRNLRFMCACKYTWYEPVEKVRG